MNSFWQNLIMTLDIYSIMQIFFSFIFGAITCFLFIRYFLRKEIRIFRNLQRKIYLLKTGPATLETEREMIAKNGLFSVNDRVLDLSNETNQLQTIDGFSVFVIGYATSYQHYQVIVNHAMAKNIPVIVLAKPLEITTEHLAIFQQYIYSEMCNSSARLLTIIFNMSLIAPYEKR